MVKQKTFFKKNLSHKNKDQNYKVFTIKIIVYIFFTISFVSCNQLINNPQNLRDEISRSDYISYQIAARFESLPKINTKLKKINNINYLNSLNDSFVLLTESGGRLIVRKLNTNNSLDVRLLFDLKLDLDQGCYAISENWRFFAHHYQGKTSVYDLKNGKVIFSTSSVRAPVTFMSFESSNAALLVSSADSHVYRFKFLEAKTCEGIQCDGVKQRYMGHGTVVTAAKHLDNTSVFISSDWEGRVIVWKFFDAQNFYSNAKANLFSNRFFSNASNSVQLRKRDNDAIEKIEINSNGSLLAVLFRSGFLEIWKIRGTKKIFRSKVLNGVPEKVVFSSDNSFLAVIDSQQMNLYSLPEILIEDNDVSPKSRQKIEPIQTLVGSDFNDIVFAGKEGVILLEKHKTLKLIDLTGLLDDE